MKLIAIAALLLMVVPDAALAETTGIELQRRCAGDSSSFCLGFIAGAIEVQQDWEYFSEVNPTKNAMNPFAPQPPHFCFPKQVTLGQIVQIVNKYLNENPEKLHFAAAPLIGAALVAAFPCPK